ncbi:hypothetical protein MK489_06010 [Myxococcota bacterium]|nr:hypothetical protein [Myxococcota bacterium]
MQTRSRLIPRTPFTPLDRWARRTALTLVCTGWLSTWLPALPSAGQEDSSWTFEVTHFEPFGNSQTLIRLKPAPHGREFPRSCSELTLYSAYEPSRWTPEMRQTVRPSHHLEALEHLQTAHLAKKLVRLGSFDRGFGAIPGYPKCEVASRGLMRVREEDEGLAIYSFY